MVEMKATDTIHVSSAGAENILEGDKFEVSEEEAKSLERRGLAKRVGGAKAEKAAPENKMEAAPTNKGVISGEGITRPARRSANRRGK